MYFNYFIVRYKPGDVLGYIDIILESNGARDYRGETIKASADVLVLFLDKSRFKMSKLNILNCSF